MSRGDTLSRTLACALATSAPAAPAAVPYPADLTGEQPRQLPLGKAARVAGSDDGRLQRTLAVAFAGAGLVIGGAAGMGGGVRVRTRRMRAAA